MNIKRIAVTDLPPMWQAIVEGYRALAPQHADPEEAFGNCFHICVDFQEYLDEKGLIDVDLFETDTVPGGYDVVEVDQLVDGTALPRWVKCHWVFRYEEWYFDWSIRQFGEEFAFPEIFKFTR